MNACIDCVHCHINGFDARCDEFTQPNPVFGGVIKRRCIEARESKLLCGVDGRYFKPNPKKDFKGILRALFGF